MSSWTQTWLIKLAVVIIFTTHFEQSTSWPSPWHPSAWPAGPWSSWRCSASPASPALPVLVQYQFGRPARNFLQHSVVVLGLEVLADEFLHLGFSRHPAQDSILAEKVARSSPSALQLHPQLLWHLRNLGGLNLLGLELLASLELNVAPFQL